MGRAISPFSFYVARGRSQAEDLLSQLPSRDRFSSSGCIGIEERGPRPAASRLRPSGLTEERYARIPRDHGATYDQHRN